MSVADPSFGLGLRRTDRLRVDRAGDAMNPTKANNLGTDKRAPGNAGFQEVMEAYDRLPAEVRRRLGEAVHAWSPIQIEQVLMGKIPRLFVHEEVKAIVKGFRL